MYVCVYMHVYVFLHVCECMHVCTIIRALQSVSHKAAAAQAHRLETCTALDALSEWLDGWMNERINGRMDGGEMLGIESLPLLETISTPAKLHSKKIHSFIFSIKCLCLRFSSNHLSCHRCQNSRGFYLEWCSFKSYCYM